VVCRFDVSSIPSNSTVSSATLQLYVNRRELLAVTNTINLYNVTKAWTESAVTQSNTGESIGSVQDNQPFPAGTGWITFNIPAALVQSWINSPATNFGLQVRSSVETHGGVAKKNHLRFDSAQSLTQSQRPKLTINYTPNGNIRPNACLTIAPKLVIRPSAQPTITADSLDPDGTIDSVQLYIDGVLKGTATNAPYAFSGYRMSLGEHNVHVVATDNAGATKSSTTNRLLCAQTIYSANMDVVPAGWTLEGAWAHGTPSGFDSASLDDFGEPAAGYTGTKILGYRLSSPYYIGAYSNGYATTVAINCTGYTNVALRFHAWLGVWGAGYGDHADIEVSNNGSTWTTVWASSNPDPNGCWTERRYNIAAVANNQPTVYVRWKMQGGQYASSYAYVGWNLDDVYLYGQAASAPIAVTFNANGGSAPSFATNDVYFGLAYDALPDSSRAGYSFSGWYTAASGGSLVTSTTLVSVAVAHTLYARWNSPPTVDAGPAQTVAMSVPTPWTPADMVKTAWYDASDASSVTLVGGKVSQWNDKSGNNRHAMQTNAVNRPTYMAADPMANNRPSIGDIAAMGKIGLNTPSMGVKHAYAVTYYKDGVDTTFDGYPTLFSGPGAGGQYRVMGNINTGTLAVTSYHFNDAGTYKNGSTNSSIVVLPMPQSLLKLKATALRTQVFSLGFNALATDRDWQGHYSEWIFTDGTETAANEQKIEGYLAHKWGMAASLPAIHPYKSAAPSYPTNVIVNLNGTVSDPDGDAVTGVTWSLVAGPAPVTFGNASVVDTTATFTTNGVYTLRLTASDASGSNSNQCVITVAESEFHVWLLDNGYQESTSEETLAANGINTLREVYVAGLNPTNTASRFELQNLGLISTNRVLQWSGVTGRLYNVYWSSNLLSGFELVQTNIPWNIGSYTDSVHRASPNGFYRIGVQLEP